MEGRKRVRDSLPADKMLMKQEPIFCFETAVKLLYWCGFVSEFGEAGRMVWSHTPTPTHTHTPPTKPSLPFSRHCAHPPTHPSCFFFETMQHPQHSDGCWTIVTLKHCLHFVATNSNFHDRYHVVFAHDTHMSVFPVDEPWGEQRGKGGCRRVILGVLP